MMKVIMCLLVSNGMFFCKSDKLYFLCFILFSYLLIKVNLIWEVWGEIYLFFSMDFYSFYLVLLSFWIIGVMLLIPMNKLMKFIILMLLMVLILSFFTFNLLMFYIMFEASLLPIFFLIKFKGYTFERFEAIMYMFMYTMLSSMPFLFIILDLFKNSSTMMYFILEVQSVGMSKMMFFFLMLVFLVKMPMFLVHIWLPKAHVEAPVYGSMILAGVLLKLGSYGILRMMQLFYVSITQVSMYYISLSLIGGTILSLICLVQVDMKMLVAYSSVVHMSLLIASLVTLSKIGFLGSYLMMISHGLCSSGLFYIVNINYEFIGSRLLLINKGSMSVFPSLSFWWFLLCIANFSAPISLNLIGEIFMLMSLMSYDFMLIIYLMMMCFFSAAYSLYLFSYTQHGEKSMLCMIFKNVNVKSYLILFIHWFPLNMLSLSLFMFMN